MNIIDIKPLIWLRGYKYIKAFNQLDEIDTIIICTLLIRKLKLQEVGNLVTSVLLVMLLWCSARLTNSRAHVIFRYYYSSLRELVKINKSYWDRESKQWHFACCIFLITWFPHSHDPISNLLAWAPHYHVYLLLPICTHRAKGTRKPTIPNIGWLSFSLNLPFPSDFWSSRRPSFLFEKEKIQDTSCGLSPTKKWIDYRLEHQENIWPFFQ